VVLTRILVLANIPGVNYRTVSTYRYKDIPLHILSDVDAVEKRAGNIMTYLL
jgi:hypothetical protein